MGNLDLYERYAQPPQNALKSFSNGKFSGTDINPMWRIKALTEAFGPCGVGWYTEIVHQWREDTPDGAATVYCHIRLYIKVDGEWSKPITGIGGNTLTRVTRNGSSTTDEAYKMAYTDAMGIACKALGIGANIWWQDARTKYTENDVSGSQPPEGDSNGTGYNAQHIAKTSQNHATACNDCGETIGGVTLPNGTGYNAQHIAETSQNTFGRCLCWKCSLKAKESGA